MVHNNYWRKAARATILLEQHGRCCYCYAPLLKGTLEHRMAQKNGGTDSYYNLAVSCGSCNAAKGHKSEESFKRFIKKEISLHWARRKIHLAGMRAEKNILRFVGLVGEKK